MDLPEEELPQQNDVIIENELPPSYEPSYEEPPSYDEVLAEAWGKQQKIFAYFAIYHNLKRTRDMICTKAFVKIQKGEDRNIETSPLINWSVNKIIELLNDKHTYYMLPIRRKDSTNFNPVIRELMEDMYPFLTRWDMSNWKNAFTHLIMNGKEYPHIKIVEPNDKIEGRNRFINFMIDKIEEAHN